MTNYQVYRKSAGFDGKSAGITEFSLENHPFPLENHHVFGPKNVLQLVPDDTIQPAFVHARCQALTADLVM